MKYLTYMHIHTYIHTLLFLTVKYKNLDQATVLNVHFSSDATQTYIHTHVHTYMTYIHTYIHTSIH